MFTLLTSEFGHAKDVLLKVAKSFFSPPSLAFLTLSGCLCGVCRAGQTEDDCVCVCVCVRAWVREVRYACEVRCA